MNKNYIHRNSSLTDQQSFSEYLAPKFWPTWAFIGFLWCFTHLPFNVQLALGRGVGWLAYHLAKSRRRVCAINIAKCYPEKSSEEQARLVKQVFLSYGQGMIETAMCWVRGKHYFEGKVEFEGIEHLDRAKEEGKGVLIVGGHFAILDLAGALLSQIRDYDIVHRSHDNPLFNLYMTRSREKYVTSCIARKDVRAMLKSLKQGRRLWYAPDQDYGRKESVFVPFFAVNEAATTTGTEIFAGHKNAVTIPTKLRRLNGTQGYEIEFLSPLVDYPAADKETSARQINAWVEQAVTDNMEQYMWVHRRFKTRPSPDAPSLYK